MDHFLGVFKNPAKPFVLPTASWRLPISNAYVSSGDSGWVTAMIASGAAKTLPTMTNNVSQPASTTRDYSLYVGAVAAPGGFVYFDLAFTGTGLITATAYESTDSTDGSTATGTWTSNSFTLWKPSGDTTNTGYGGRGQFIRLAAGAARWVRLRIVTPASTTVLPYFGAFQLQTNGAQDMWAFLGNSLTTFPFSSRSVRSTIQLLYPTADPIVLFTARSGANAAGINSEQISELQNNAQLAGVLNVMIENSSGDVALSGVRPYSTDATHDQVGSRFVTNISALVAKYGVGHVYASNIPFSNLTAANGNIAPYVNGDITSTNGNLPYNTYQVEPNIKSLLTKTSWSTKYDAPLKDDYLGDASDFGNFLVDGVHPTTRGIYAWRDRCSPMFKKAYGFDSGESTLDQLVKQVGSQATSAKKTNLQALFNVMTPTTDAGGLANRATVQSAITAIATSFTDFSSVSGNYGINSSSITSATLLSHVDASEFTKFTDSFDGYVSLATDRKNGYSFTQSTEDNKPRRFAYQADGSRPHFNFALGYSGQPKVLSSTDAGLIGALNAGGVAWTLVATIQMDAVATTNNEYLFSIGDASHNFFTVDIAGGGCVPHLNIGDTTGTDGFFLPTDTALVPGTRFTFAFRRTASGTLKYTRGSVTATGSTAKNGAVTGLVARIGQPAAGSNTVNFKNKLFEKGFYLTDMSDADLAKVLAGQRERWSDSSKTCI